ncbi:hypothetical protein D3C86_2035670 [compost metagenome]
MDIGRGAPHGQLLGPHFSGHGLEVGLRVGARDEFVIFALGHRIDTRGEQPARFLVLVPCRFHGDIGINAQRHRARAVQEPIVVAPVFTAIGLDQ